jgi:hypothetical protein
MRAWLERALQIDAQPFANAQDALDAFDVLPNEIDVQRAESKRAWLHFRLKRTMTRYQVRLRTRRSPGRWRSRLCRLRPPLRRQPDPRTPVVAELKAPVVVAATSAKSNFADAPVAAVAKAPATAVAKPPATRSESTRSAVVKSTGSAGRENTGHGRRANRHARGPRPTPATPTVTTIVRPRLGRFGRVTLWVVGGLAVLAATEAIGLWLLSRNKPAADGRAATQTAAPANGVTEPPAPAATTGRATPALRRRVPRRTPRLSLPAANAAAPASGGSGRLRVSSAIELRVFMDGQMIGSSAGALTVSEGFHRFEFVNDAFDFR